MVHLANIVDKLPEECMVAVIERLKSNTPSHALPEPCQGRRWSFFQNLPTNDRHLFSYYVKNHALLSLEYSVHRSQLAADLQAKNKVSLIPQIEAALIMAEILECVYEKFLIVPREVARLRSEQLVYRQWLQILGPQGTPPQEYQFSRDLGTLSVAQTTNKTIREQTLPANLYRHMVGRTRRFVMIMAPVIFGPEAFKPWLTQCDYYMLPVLNYASWIFFFPRTAVNLVLMSKHIIPGGWMSDTEKSLSIGTRFRAQMERRWLELGNDLAAVAVNMTNCFVLVGALTPWALYLTTVSLAYDVLLAGIRSYIEISRLKDIERTYEQMLAKDNSEQISGYLAHLRVRIQFEELRLYSSVWINLSLLVAMVLTLPVYGFPPLMPVIGAALAVMTTIAWFASIGWVNQSKPSDKVPAPLSSPPLVTETPGSAASSSSPVRASSNSSGFFAPDDPRSPNSSSASLAPLLQPQG